MGFQHCFKFCYRCNLLVIKLYIVKFGGKTELSLFKGLDPQLPNDF